MTDEHSHEEHEPEPHGMIGKDGELWFRDVSGDWHKHERVSTGDPEKDRILEMSTAEVDEILADPEHPLFDKATEVSIEISRRIAASVRPWGLVHPEVTKQFFGFISDQTVAKWFLRLPAESRPSFVRGFELTLPFQLARGRDFSSDQDDRSESEPVEDESTTPDEVDTAADEEGISGVEPIVVPANDAPVIVRVDFAEEAARKFDSIHGTLEQTRIDTNRSADEANRLSAEANKIARHARLISWIALGVSAVAAGATIFG